MRVSQKLSRNVDYTVTSSSIHSNLTKMTVTGEYSYLTANLVLKNRSWCRVFVTVFIPGIIMVKLAWLSFFIDRKTMYSTRLMYCLLLLVLTAVNINLYNIDRMVSENVIDSAVNQLQLQSVQTRADDCWTGVVMLFVFGALVDLFVLSWLDSRGDLNASEKQDLENQGNLEPLVVEEGSANNQKYKVTKLEQLKNITSDRLEHLVKVFFPLLFALYAIIYCIWFCLF